ncbi:MAG: hypothetical protein VYD54_09520 [Bdellovibrionota bacterium]|nr:hypothetical protein [Bdellovibrionota bacterium]
MENFTTNEKVALLKDLIKSCKADNEREVSEIRKTSEAFINTLLSEGKVQKVSEIVDLLRLRFPKI